MRSLVEWITFGLPWWLWAFPAVLIAAAIFFAVSRVVGVRNAIAAASIVGSAMLLALSRHRGRQDGWAERIKQENDDAQQISERAEKARNRVNTSPERLRDDDGFRRH